MSATAARSCWPSASTWTQWVNPAARARDKAGEHSGALAAVDRPAMHVHAAFWRRDRGQGRLRRRGAAVVDHEDGEPQP